MIITNPLFFKCLEKHGFIFHHSSRGAGYRNKYYYWKRGKSNTPVIGYLKRYKGKYGRGYILECVTDSNNICANHNNFYYIKKEYKPLIVGDLIINHCLYDSNIYNVYAKDETYIGNKIFIAQIRIYQNDLIYMDGVNLPPYVENAIIRALQGKEI